MNRIILCIAIALVTIGPAHSAWADDPAPTKEQLEAAKKAFAEGKALFDAGKLVDAVEKFKESYRLSRNALLLYNIGHTLDQAGQKDKALFYYRKFLADAPPSAAQRKDVQKRVDVLEKENLEADLQGTTTTTATPPSKTEEPKQVKVKPAGTYSATDFQHQLVEAAPPGKPLDVTAFVPEDSGFTVTLYYRGAGESQFKARPMRWRYKELVARIPAKMMSGSSIQYYIEVKDQAGNAVTKSGKSTSPNLVNIDPAATARFYPDFTDESAEVNTAESKRHDERDNPLGAKGGQVADSEPQGQAIEGPAAPSGNGLTDVGSSKFKRAKFWSTISAGALIGGAVVSFILAKKQNDNLAADASSCGPPPCRMFDLTYDLEVQKAGQRYNTIYQITGILGIASAGVAGYFWYRDLTNKKRVDVNAKKQNGSPEATWAITPAFGDGYTGAAAAARF